MYPPQGMCRYHQHRPRLSTAQWNDASRSAKPNMLGKDMIWHSVRDYSTLRIQGRNGTRVEKGCCFALVLMKGIVAYSSFYFPLRVLLSSQDISTSTLRQPSKPSALVSCADGRLGQHACSFPFHFSLHKTNVVLIPLFRSCSFPVFLQTFPPLPPLSSLLLRAQFLSFVDVLLQARPPFQSECWLTPIRRETQIKLVRLFCIIRCSNDSR